MKNVYTDFYKGPERRITPVPRRARLNRRHRLRRETLVSDCRLLKSRRREDEEGIFDVSGIYIEEQIPQH